MPYPAFDITAILLDQIFQVSILSDLYAVNGIAAGIKFRKDGCVCTAFIDGHHFWLTVVANGFSKETQGFSFSRLMQHLLPLEFAKLLIGA